MSHQILLLFLFSSLLAWSSADDVSQPEASDSRIKKHLMILDSKLDSLNKEMEQLKADRPTENDVESSINITLIVINALQQWFQTQLNEIKRDVTSEITSQVSQTQVNEIKRDVMSEMTSQVSQVKSQLDRVESQLNQQKACFNACEPNPCIYGGSCVPILCGKDFMCDKCPKFRSGLRCEKLEVKCEGDDKCWVHNDMMYVVLEPKSNWTEAKRKCEAEGMRLIMPKEKDQTEFIVNKLRAVYGTGGGQLFWMGLKREGGSGWRWSDGSELGSYAGGESQFKSLSGDKYGILHLGGGNAMWSWHHVTSSNIYPLCEKRV